MYNVYSLNTYNNVWVLVTPYGLKTRGEANQTAAKWLGQTKIERVQR